MNRPPPPPASARAVIGITGHKGSGKDTAAEGLVAQGFTHVKLADALKAMLRKLLACQGADAEMIRRMIDGDLKEAPTPLLEGRTPRHAMQTLGTEWGRDRIGRDLWANAALARCENLPGDVVISDVRFPNEAEAIRAVMGGRIWRIVREGCDGDGHPSETAMAGIEADRTIRNDAPSPVAFQHRIEALWREVCGDRCGAPHGPSQPVPSSQTPRRTRHETR